MAALARVLSLALPLSRKIEIEVIQTIGIVCVVWLLTTLLVLSYGLDLSAGFL
jgi:hypothetical protein